MKHFLILSLILVIVAGCSPVPRQLSAWQGARLDDLIRQVGPPSSVSTGPDGTKLYHWFEDRGGAYTYVGFMKLWCERVFSVDDQEIITSFTWSGNCLAIPDSPWQRGVDGEERGQ